MKRNKAKTKKNMSEQEISYTDPYAAREQQKYDEPIASREYILQLIGDCKRPPTFKQLTQGLRIANQQQRKALDRRLNAMLRDGQLKLVNNRYQLIPEIDLIIGEVIGHPDGFGFIKYSKTKPDLYLPSYEMRKVLTGDIVQVLPVVSQRSSNKLEAKIVKIVSRKIKQLVGKLISCEQGFLLQPENSSINNKIYIDSSSLQDRNLHLKQNQVVLAEIINYQTATEHAKARIVEIIGDYFAPGIEIQTALRRYEIPNEWPTEVLKEVECFPVDLGEEHTEGRVDFRNLALVTIDGEDAKDFDDAVYCQKLDNGGFQLIVAIADVSTYVKPNSSLDKEAYLRGTSVYFPGQVVPMLPEVLSNGLCSLNPNVDRLCFACEAELDQHGTLVRYRFMPGVMRSQARLTYTKVAEILLNNNQEMTKQYSSLVPYLNNLYELFQVLNKSRQARGAIDFDSTETMIEFDDERKIAAIHPVVRNDAHRLIEECMLVANVAAAHFCLNNEIPVLYRNHDAPPQEKLEKLQEFLRPLGLALKNLPPTPKDISSVLTNAHNRPDNHVIQTVVLRSLSQAMYEPMNKGHFGLAFDQYAHFTSPIRRYPDLLLHRHLHYYLATSNKWQKFACEKFKNLDKNSHAYFKNFKNNLVACGEHCSATERRADEATRDVVAWLKCEYMQDKLGNTFTGCISGITSFGIFVELDEVYVEGMLHVSHLRDDYYTFDERRHLLYGEHTGKRYHIGDKLTVIVAKVDLDSRRIDFVLPEFATSISDPDKSKKSQFKHKKHKSKQDTSSNKPGRSVSSDQNNKKKM